MEALLREMAPIFFGRKYRKGGCISAKGLEGPLLKGGIAGPTATLAFYSVRLGFLDSCIKRDIYSLRCQELYFETSKEINTRIKSFWVVCILELLGKYIHRGLILGGPSFKRGPAVYKSLHLISHHLVLKLCWGGKNKK